MRLNRFFALSGVVLAAGAAALPATAAARTDPARAAHHSLSLSADLRDTGWIALRLHATPGVELQLGEASSGAGVAPKPFTPDTAFTVLRRFARWDCAKRVRRFTVSQPGADGLPRDRTVKVRTPSCRRRLAIAAPGSVSAGGAMRVRVRDRWGTGGIDYRLCAQPPGGARSCSPLTLGAGRAGRASRVPTLRPGTHLVSVRTPYGRASRAVYAAPAGGRLRLLATGDSMIQIVDSYLKERLGPLGVSVTSEDHISTGISKPSLLDWQAKARSQAAGRPDVTVVFLGANDGFPMGDAQCCGEAWIAEYQRRAHGMMRSYARGGRGRVYWVLLPTPREGFFRQVFPAVNTALRRAARGLEQGVRIIDLGPALTPGGRFQEKIKYRGKLIKVRNGDGVHLAPAGASIAASMLIRALRGERFIR